MRGLIVTAAIGALFGLSLLTTENPGGQASETEGPTTSHFRVERPAQMGDDHAEGIYLRIHDKMVAGYALSGNLIAIRYRTWQRVNIAPYRSTQHGERYVNNYANAVAADYGDPDARTALRVGSVIVKDSFAVTEQGDVFSGPLAIMEKMPAGFNPAAGDWRYTLIMPDGSLFGTTGGVRSQEVDFCAACHSKHGVRDHLFRVPESYRASPPALSSQSRSAHTIPAQKVEKP